MRFEHFYFLFLLVPILPAMILFFWWSMKRRRELMTKFVQARLLPNLSVGVSSAMQKTRFALLLGAIALLVVAVARPQWGYDIVEVKQKGLDIVVAIDTSKSMLAEDIAPNRLARAKLAALDLIQQAKSDRVGLVAFAGSAFLQCPLTLDDVAFKQSLDTLDVNIIPQGGTALAEAIETAITAFKADDNYKILVLFTDGEDNDEGAFEAATKAAAENMKIYPVGIGTPEGELLRIKDAKGRSDYIRDADGSVVKSRLNERLLQEIARAGNGVYLRLSGAKTVETLYEKAIAPLPKSEHAAKLTRKYHEQFFWPLGLAILLLIIEMFLPERKREKRTTRPANTRVTTLAATVLILAVPLFAPASPSSALRKYEAGNFNESLKEYHQLLEKKSTDPRLHFNAGAAAYRNKEFNEAAKQFSEALSAQDLQVQQRAYYNLGNTLYQLGENAAEDGTRMQQWTNSLQSFQNALVLNTNDVDAKFNYAFVKKKLEELQKQQQQQQSQNQKQDQNKDGQSKNDSQGKQDQENKQQQQNQQEQAKQDQQQQQKQKEEEQKQSAKSSPQGGEQSKEQQQAEAQPVAAGQMTEQQAKRLLDAQKGHEQVLIFKPTGEKDKPRTKTLKDW